MTSRHGGFGPLNTTLLLAAFFGFGFFVFAESQSTSPLIRMAMFRKLELTASLVTSALVSTVMMATLIVGPLVAALTAVPARQPKQFCIKNEVKV